MVWSEGGADYIHRKPFSGAQLLELWYRILEALLYLLRGLFGRVMQTSLVRVLTS